MGRTTKTTTKTRGRGDARIDTERAGAPSPSKNGRGDRRDDTETLAAASVEQGRGGDATRDTDTSAASSPSANGSAGENGIDTDERDARRSAKKGRGVDQVTVTETDRVSSPSKNGSPGERSSDTETCSARRPRTKAREGDHGLDTDICTALSRRLTELKQRRDLFLKLRIQCVNALTAAVANVLGYKSGMTEEERKRHWDRARAEVQKVLRARGERTPDADAGHASPRPFNPESSSITIWALVSSALPSLSAFDKFAHENELQMKRLARQLPVWPWAQSIHGVGELMLANIIGETGDLSLYANPGKVWRRMGCAPFTSQGETHTGKAWRVGKPWTTNKLSAEEWEEFGYCGRRRSVVYKLTDALRKACCGKNAAKDGADNDYIKRYHEAKAAKLALGWPPIRADAHGMLLMGKRFLRDLWRQWRVGDCPGDTEKQAARSP